MVAISSIFMIFDLEKDSCGGFCLGSWERFSPGESDLCIIKDAKANLMLASFQFPCVKLFCPHVFFFSVPMCPTQQVPDRGTQPGSQMITNKIPNANTKVKTNTKYRYKLQMKIQIQKTNYKYKYKYKYKYQQEPATSNIPTPSFSGLSQCHRGCHKVLKILITIIKMKLVCERCL